MSEDRRKKQQERQDDGGKMNKALLYVIIFALFVGAYLAGLRYRTEMQSIYQDLSERFHASKYDSFAKCLASKNAKMYGLYWCPHCADQKREFGASFRYVPYIECASPEDPHQLAPACKAAGLKLFPSWQFGTDPPKE